MRRLQKEESQQKRQQPSSSTPNNEDNISTKSNTQQSQSSILNTLEIITNSITKTQFYNIDNDNTDESFEYRKPTMNDKLDHIHISADQVKNQIKNHPMGQNTNDDVELLKSRIDNIDLMLENQNKLISDIESSIKHCIYQIYCKL